jgi:hypothetical protein
VDENTSTLLRLVYKKIAVFLRSLISYVRIVPAFDVARRCRSQISYDVSSPEEHDSEETTADKKNPTFDCVVSNTRFTPIVAPFGTLIVSSTYRRNVSEFLKASSSPPPPLDLLDRRQRRRSWTPTQQRDFDDVDDWIVPHRTSIPREKKKILRYSPYGLPPRTPVTTTTIDMQHVPHSAPATARTGFYMLERHMQEKCTRTKLFYEEKEKDDSMKKTTNPIPIISKSLAKPKLVRRISRSADDKEFGKYWNELPKQMRRVKEEEEENITVTPNSRSRVDTDVHILAFGSPTLTSMEDENEKTRRPSVTSSPGSETPPFASTTSKMSITPLRLVGPALEKYPKVVKTSIKKQHEKEIEISSFRRESSSLNDEEEEEEEIELQKSEEEEELPFAMQDEDEISGEGSSSSSSSTTKLTTEFQRLKKSDSGIGKLVAKCDNAPMLRAIEIARESGSSYFRRDVDRQFDFFESFERTLSR